MLKRVFTDLYRFIWYLFAAIVLSVAVLVTTVRLALPEIDAYQQEIQSWVSDHMGYPVTIGKISAEWQGWTPHLYLEEVDLYTQNRKQAISQFDSAQISINLIASLIRLEVVPNQLSVSGVSLAFTRDIDGSISISGDDKNRLNTKADQANALSEWLLKKKQIILENATLLWHDKKNASSPIRFSNTKLILKTDKERVQLEAVIGLPEQYGQFMQISMDITGNVLNSDWDGDIYLEARKVKAMALLKDLPVYSRIGTVDLTLWTSWKEARLHDFDAVLENIDFSLNTEGFELPIKSTLVKLYGERQRSKDWLINVQMADLQTMNSHWPKGDYHFNIKKNEAEDRYQYNAYFSYLKLEAVLPFLMSNTLPEAIAARLQRQSVKGELGDLVISTDPVASSFQFVTQFKNLTITDHDTNFSVTNLAGSLQFDNETAKIQLDSKESEINIASLYDAPFFLSEVKADLEFIDDGMSATLFINDMNIRYADASIKTAGEILIEEGAAPFINLLMKLETFSVEAIPKLIPKKENPELYQWLSSTLVSGEILSGDLIYRGDISSFPFKNADGYFKAILNLEKAILNYNEGWPPIDNLTAEVIFENDNLLVSSNFGYIFDARINDVKAKINNISADELSVIVDGSLTGDANDARYFILQSPLNSNAPLVESTKNIAGDLELKLKLNIPLGEEKSTVDGVATLVDATIGANSETSSPWLFFEKVNGNINFNRDTFWIERLDALYYGNTVTLSMETPEQEGVAKFIISGVADKTFIVNQLTRLFPPLMATSHNIEDYFSGKSKWDLTISNKKEPDNSRSQFIELNTELDGITLNLPYPLGKLKNEVRPLKIKTKLTNSLIDQIDIDYNNHLFTNIMIDNRQGLTVKNILVGLGGEHAQGKLVNHVSIQGELEQLDLSEWIEFIGHHKSFSTSDNTGKTDKPIYLNILTKKLNLFGNDFDEVNITLTNPDDSWQFVFDGAQLKGRVQLLNVPTNFAGRLNIELEHIVLHKALGQQNKQNIALEDLPKLEVSIEKTIYKERDLGKTTLLTSNIKDGINIDKLSFTKPDLVIDASGKWVKSNAMDHSEFTVKLNSESIDSILTLFGYDKANIENGQTSIELQASWMDTPMNFSVDKIDGALEMTINKGQFLDIDPSMGRLFGLLNIQTLYRRLSLDFTDMFSEGLAFDSIKGSFNLQQGHAYTNNLEMQGPSADIIISGRTGLITEDYDQIATITPKVSDTLPVASVLLGPAGIGVGVGIYIASELFEPISEQINKVLRYQYSITGSWEEPTIEKITKEATAG